MAKNNIKSLTSFLFEVGTLRKIIRGHSQSLLTSDTSDNIASHSFRVTLIGYLLAENEGLDTGKVVKMCILHDVGEARSGDQNWIHKKYVKVFDDEIVKDQLSFLPESSDMHSIAKEYKERKTKESKVAKDADLIDQLLLLREYEWQGNLEAKRWLKGARNHEKMLYSKTAKKLAEELRKQSPSFWWENSWSQDRR